MKRKSFYAFLIAEAAVLCSLHIFTAYLPSLFPSAIAFPFEQIGLLLRAMSLSCRVGNGISLMLWVAICLLPLLPILRHVTDKERKWEHLALVIMSLVLFPVLYYMTNPTLLLRLSPVGMEEILPVFKGVLSAAVWSVLVCYLVFRLLRQFRHGDKELLFRYLRNLLFAICALFVGTIALSCLGQLLSDLQKVRTTADGFLSLFRFMVSALPYFMDAAVTLCAISLLDALLLDERSDQVVTQAKKLSNLCGISLAAVTTATMTLNLLQLMMAKHLSDISVNVEIPLLSLAFVLAALLLARLILENKQLADDNELFI